MAFKSEKCQEQNTIYYADLAFFNCNILPSKQSRPLVPSTGLLLDYTNGSVAFGHKAENDASALSLYLKDGW